jgi:hypothetical protein
MEGALIGIAESVDGVGARIDRLTAATARGRTQDSARLDDHDRSGPTIANDRKRSQTIAIANHGTARTSHVCSFQVRPEPGTKPA